MFCILTDSPSRLEFDFDRFAATPHIMWLWFLRRKSRWWLFVARKVLELIYSRLAFYMTCTYDSCTSANNRNREKTAQCLIINGVIAFIFRLCRLFAGEQTRREHLVEGNRGTCCQGKWSLKKYLCLMKSFRLHCSVERKNFHNSQRFCECILACFTCCLFLCAARTKIAWDFRRLCWRLAQTMDV